MSSTDSTTRETAEQATPPARWPAWKSPAAHSRFWSLAILALLLDWATKQWAIAAIGEPAQHQPIVLIPNVLRFITVYNEGAVAGLASGQTTLLILASLAAMVFLIGVFLNSTADRALVHLSTGMLMGGALGNLGDRLFNQGRVIDFIDVNLGFWPANPWPTFNIADVFLTVGVIILIIESFRLPPHEPRPQRQPTPTKRPGHTNESQATSPPASANPPASDETAAK